eukprot:TRINITY_DN1529_c0_g1_i2.p1 TRINITY_DN1529_c0_g1~~TRINITY_DN1529_c0_g1_i2.p1  ORF type:complete len:413 (+),score=72.83 TRINITY_DN1529_c0_g1_i2:133-1239(+)
MPSAQPALQVHIRSRPLLRGEQGDREKGIHPRLKDTDTGGITLEERKEKFSIKTQQMEVVTKRHGFPNFARVYCEESNNEAVFTHACQDLVSHTCDGNRSAIFAYGFTGTGKSHTMYGSGPLSGNVTCAAGDDSLACVKENMDDLQLQDQAKETKKHESGIATLAALELLRRIESLGAATTTAHQGGAPRLRVCMYEVYGKVVRDLLDPELSVCTIRTSSTGNIYLRKDEGGDITRVEVTNEADFLATIRKGIASRKVGSSTVHDESSRSHAILELDVVTDDILSAERNLLEAEANKVTEANELDNAVKARIKEVSAADICWYHRPENRELVIAMGCLGEESRDLAEIVDKARNGAAESARGWWVRGR